MKIPEPRNLVGLIAILLVCVQLSNGFSIQRDKREAETPEQKPKLKLKKISVVKRQGIPVKAEDNRLVLNGKVKISELKPCISKAFCEVNSITEEPTYETNKEFYIILNRLKKFIDDDDDQDQEQRNIPGSGSVEDEEESSEESSYENVPYAGSGYPPRHPGYRRGKSMDNKDVYKINKKKKKPIKQKSPVVKNGTLAEDSKTNKTVTAKSQAKIEQRSFVERKTRELNVVDDLAALIKISSEIGQALRSPRRCRALFKKCEMSYDQIINIFNQTQSVETADDVSPPAEDSSVASLAPQKPSKPTRVTSTATTTTTKESKITKKPVESVEDESNDGNRKQKSRHEFSDEDIEYITDTEIQPVKTYALFAPQEQHDNRHPEEILVEEAFKKFENTFPLAGAPENLDFLKKSSKSKKLEMEPARGYSSSEEESSDESGSRERTDILNGDQYQHRSSGEHRERDRSEEDRHSRKGKKKAVASDIEESIATPVDEAEDDSEAFISSAEISKNPEIESKRKPAVEQLEQQADEGESEESEEGSDEEDKVAVYTRDEEEYPSKKKKSRPSSYDRQEDDLTLKGSKKYGSKNKRGNKSKPQKEEEMSSSEERERDPNFEQNRPPPDSEFYSILQGMNDGKGADGVPEKASKGHKKGKKSGYGQPSYDDQSQYGGQGGGGGYDDPYGSYGGGKPSSSGGYGSQPPYGAQSDPSGQDQNSQGFFSSIMNWFSFGGSGTKAGSAEEQSPYGGGGGSGGYGNQPSTYDDYKPGGGGRPSGYGLSQGYGGGRPAYRESGEDEYSGKRRPGGRPQGRGDEEESSEEAEDDIEEGAEQEERELEREREEPVRSSSKGERSKKKSHSSKSEKSSNTKKSGPPPPLVIVPEGEENYAPTNEYATIPKEGEETEDSGSKKTSQKDSNKGKGKDGGKNKKQKQPEPEASEESRETSSEENNKNEKIQNPRAKSGLTGQQEGIPSYEKYYTGIFGSGEDIEKNEKQANARRKHLADEKRKKSSLLLSTFDTISSSFSTSADKIPDWSEEDNPKSRINVGSLSHNDKKSKGKYTVVRNRNRNKNAPQSYEMEDKVSSEEDKKRSL